jgi:transposase
MVVGVVLDSEGRPVCSEMWPGNTTDVTTLIPVVDRLRRRFGIRRICIVADRGMISAKTLEELENPERCLEYILGARMRVTSEVREEVLGRSGRFKEVHPKRRKSKDSSPLKVKEVWVEDRRYVVCHNEEQAKKDREDREAILASLKEALKRGDKSLVGNKGYRRYLKTTNKSKGFAIDEKKIKSEARFDGKWVLRTNTDLPVEEVALKYKQLWMVENVFRSMKSVLETRPIWHKCDEAIRGHVFCSFLAMVLMKTIQDGLDDRGVDAEWAHLISDLDRLEEVEVDVSGKKFVLRSETRGAVGKLFQAVGASLPPTIRQA